MLLKICFGMHSIYADSGGSILGLAQLVRRARDTNVRRIPRALEA